MIEKEWTIPDLMGTVMSIYVLSFFGLSGIEYMNSLLLLEIESRMIRCRRYFLPGSKLYLLPSFL